LHIDLASRHAVLAEGACELGLSLTGQQLSQLVEFAGLIRETNTAFNLVSRRDIDRLETRHILDSLSLAAWLRTSGVLRPGLRLLDVGSGAGFPGLVLAIVLPDLHVALVDRAARKARFLQRTISALGLANAVAKCHDVVSDRVSESFEIITCRAVAPVSEVWMWVVDGLVTNGLLLHMSHTVVEASRTQVCLPGGEDHFATLTIPGLDAKHGLTVVRKVAGSG
jgi:16S rRNA (guanine527-N7)-methyltransferase